MSRRVLLLVFCGLLGLAVAAGAAPALKSRPAPNTHIGRWAATGMQINGKPQTRWQGLEYEFVPGGR